MPPAIDVEHLWQRFVRNRRRRGFHRYDASVWALRDVSFSVAPGEAFGVIGANGSGKTTLLQSLAGVLVPSRGAVRVTGRTGVLVDVLAGTEREFSGWENIFVSGVLAGLSRAEVRRRTPDIVAFSGLTEEELEAPFRTYSAGMGLRLGFSIVLATEPDVLLVDEVLAVGDANFQRRCIDAVERRLETGGSLVLVSHDLDLVARHCDRVALLDHGELVEVGQPQRVIERYEAMTVTDAEPSATTARNARGRGTGR